jgi:GT2 family glycosyltransferase/ubiquinone/menaquinone biosynthesis C-methylase UbiE
MKFTGEFFIPQDSNDHHTDIHELEIEHRQRYMSILKIVEGRTVLDIASGEGYGSSLLSSKAGQVYGVDINPALTAHASQKYTQQNIHFLSGSVENIPMEHASVDIVVSFETIEHVSADMQRQFLREVKRVLKPGGVFIVSTPDKKNYTDRYDHHNEFHLKELYKAEFEDLLKTQFGHVTLYDQGMEISSLILNQDDYTAQKSLPLFRVGDKYHFEGKYVIALCSDLAEAIQGSIASIVPETNRSYLQTIDRILQMQLEIEELGAWGKRSAGDNETLHSTFQKQNAQLEAQSLEVERLNNSLRTAYEENHDFKRELEQKSNQVYRLEAEKKELESRLKDIYSSDGYKLLSVYYRLKGKYLPEDSGRLLKLKAFGKFLKSKKVLSKLRGKIPPVTVSDTQLARDYNVIPGVPPDISFPLAFPVFDQPLVSIIIPAYNNWAFTRNCLISIYQHTDNIPYEIIVGDNVSTDETINLEKYFTNVNYLRNKENLGYIRNINNAASHARGQFILTLNNDTTVTGNWLSSMLDVMNRDKKVGLVGSKLVFPDGTLQEAGGIIWKDTSGWNYGRGADPEAPEYNYLKEVDYISGASNLVRKELWEKLKGLDEQYVPAYFDDSDLAFSIRQLGYKTIYQPLSVVIHYEGLTHGTNTSSGTKKYQVINAKKFSQKWQDALRQDHFPNGEEVFHARDRSKGRKTIVVIDHYVPEFDKDAGSRTTFQVLKILARNNYNVKFVGDNFYRQEPYTTHLQQMGIEVLYGEYYRNNWKDWITENRKYIDFFYINRPHISIKYIDAIREQTDAKIIYYGHDLHFVREQLQYEIKKDPKLLHSAGEWKQIETELVRKSDTILTLSYTEKEIIEKEIGHKDIRIMPAFSYSGFNEAVTDFGRRSDLLFVGGFQHKPNVDAVLWFAKEVFPAISDELKNVRFIIAGSKPPREVTKLASDKIVVKGYISDQELEDLYRNIKLVLIPLRYGAGVKGKTVEAMYHGVPFVTTSFGIEGLKDISAVTVSQDIAAEFAGRVIELYTDNDKLEAFSRKEIAYAKQYFSEDAATDIILKTFA